MPEFACVVVVWQIFEEKQTRGWIDVANPLISRDGEKILMLTSQKQEDGHFYHHILQFDKNTVQKSITKGSFSVESIEAWDEDRNIM